MTTITPPCRLDLSSIFSKSEKIHVANYTHFIALSFLFLPLCFYLITTPIFHLLGQLLSADQIHTLPQNFNFWENIMILMILSQDHQNCCYVIPNIFYILIAYLLTMCAISTITYSTHHGFSSKPVNFFTTVKSLKSYFSRIVTTAITAHSLIFLFFLTFLLFVQTNLMLIQNLGFVIDYNSSNFVWFSYIIVAILIAVVTYLHVNWSLAFVVVVVESKSGVSALRRSACLVKGMRSVSLVLFLYFGLILGILVWVMPICLHAYSDWQYVLFALMTGSGLLMSYMRQWTCATTVLYNYCLFFHGQSNIDKFGRGYVNLPSEDEKVIKVPCVVVGG